MSRCLVVILLVVTRSLGVYIGSSLRCFSISVSMAASGDIKAGCWDVNIGRVVKVAGAEEAVGRGYGGIIKD